MSTKTKIDSEKLPKHVAIIMDGNGRWAQSRSKDRSFGHENGVHSVRAVTEAVTELGIKYLTLYAFSTENWNRPKEEIDALMSLLVSAIDAETPTLMKNNIRLASIGAIESLLPDAQRSLLHVIEKTKQNTGTTLILALSYSSRWEITEAVKNIVQKAQNNLLSPEDITAETISQHLNTAPYPDPELLIRTSGEYRLSNYLLWQIAYTELYFTETLWPDFGKEEFYQALLSFQSRERRFGKTTAQINSSKEH